MPWHIEKLQLFFYNGCDNRWQLFQQGMKLPSGTDNSRRYFRTQIAELLTTTLAAVETEIPPQTNRSDSTETLNTTIKLEREDADSEMVSIPFTASDRNMLDEFSLFLCEALVQEGLSNSELVRNIESSCIDARTTTGAFSWSIPRKSFADLLSVLPIARDWDVWGWLHPMSTSSVRFQPETYWWRRFSYQVRFERRETEPTDDQPLFGWNVYLRLIAQQEAFTEDEQRERESKRNPEVAARIVRPSVDPRSEIPYFNFAKSPTLRREGQPVMSNEEKALYRLYGAIIDAAQHRGSQTSTSYFGVFPVIACGYYHFFEMEMVADRLETDDPLLDCDSFLRKKLSGYSYFILKESLRELLVQIRLSAFQHHVSQWISKHATEILNSFSYDERHAIDCFCACAPLINEMRVITCEHECHQTARGVDAGAEDGDSQVVWAHAGGQKTSRVDAVLMRWAKVKAEYVEKDQDGCFRISLPNGAVLLETNYRKVIIGQRICIWLFHEGADTEFAERFFEGTNQRRLEEQFEVVQDRIRRFWHSIR